MNAEQYIDHEVRIRLLEKTCKETSLLLRWTLGTVVTVGVTVLLHSFNLI